MTGTLTRELTTAHRCDRCGAQAFLRARLAEGFELLFCVHHGRQHMEKLQGMDGVEILDESHILDAEEGHGNQPGEQPAQ